MIRLKRVACVVCVVWASCAAAGAVRPDETPGGPGQWGFRPVDGGDSAVNPPAFVWRPQRGAASYEFELARTGEFRDAYRAAGLTYHCHCPDRTLAAGRWFWRFRFRDSGPTASAWSRTRSVTIDPKAVAFPMPPRKELIGRIPTSHPRLFVRPERIPALRTLAGGRMKDDYAALVRRCDGLLARPPASDEPPKYPPGMVRKSDQWAKIWWGNRRRTIEVLNGAATLAFTRLLGGRDEYGRLAKRLLLAAATWDPKGATGYHYNDEAGMPYCYYFARTYTFVHDMLTEPERVLCRKVMAVRGAEMYAHLAGRHLWQPYSSHSNRAWHFLGEAGIAFLGEIPQAEEWVWFAMNVFYHVYPVWSDAQGGWHEGVGYWSSYVGRFTWWADVMRAATGVDAYRKPYFSQVGYYPLYLQPPGTRGGGFGDLTARRTSGQNQDLMAVLAGQAGNPYWQWYVEAHGPARRQSGYVEFVRGAGGTPKARPPDDLPTARCFRGTGQAMLNTTLLAAKDNVQVIFKSSPFGTQSHGYESSNSFLLYAFGERLLIRTGRRDIYGSRHHTQWMWQTRSTNCITVDGRGQAPHSGSPCGEIAACHTDGSFNFVSGEAAAGYGGRLKRFTRSILMVKPDLVVIFDRLEAPAPARFEYLLHAPTEMRMAAQGDIRIVSGRAACRAAILAPAGLKLSQTSAFDPPPRPRVKLVEWHLTARTARPARSAAFVTVLRVYRAGEAPPAAAALAKVDGGYELQAPLRGGRAVVLLRTRDSGEVGGRALKARADLAAFRYGTGGGLEARMLVEGRTVRRR